MVCLRFGPMPLTKQKGDVISVLMWFWITSSIQGSKGNVINLFLRGYGLLQGNSTVIIPHQIIRSY